MKMINELISTSKYGVIERKKIMKKKTLKDFRKVENLERIEENFKRLYWMKYREFKFGIKLEDDEIQTEACQQMNEIVSTYVSVVYGITIYENDFLDQGEIADVVEIEHQISREWENEYNERNTK